MAEETPVTPAADSGTPAAAPSQEGAVSSTPASESSSPAPAGDTGQSKGSLLDAVLKVVPASTEPDVLATAKPTEPAVPPETASPAEDQATPETEEAETAEDDDAPPPPETAPAARRKINKLLKQRRELRSQVAAMERPAEIGSQIQAFVTQNDLTDDDFANTLKIAALLKSGDYRGFYEAVAPYVRSAQEYLGVVLPRDLSEQVRIGQMTEATARNFARQRYDMERANYERQNLEVAQSRQRVEYVKNDVQRAVSSLEQRMAANDPDYKAKAPAVRRAAQALLFERGGQISHVGEALEITQAAYNEVNRHFRSMQPRPTATSPQANGASQSPSARAAPKTLMEAALQGLENSRRTGG
jgi:hypothetical protein